MQHPFQCLATVSPTIEQGGGSRYLLVACGHELLSVDVKEGRVASQWPAEDCVPEDKTENGNGDGERPAKKQKANHAAKVRPNIVKLTIAPNQQHVIAVTDDKCVHVFSIIANGKLDELSQRIMPKRPCALQVLPDNATMLIADKFGDVYSLPLLPTSIDDTDDATPGAGKESTPQPDKPAFKPSATTLTVHSKRNRMALEAQMKQKDFSARKEPLKFEHKLLLGHVSMLTDMLYATQEVDGKQKGYIITADRDEHIRISRGPPQAHIIEGYCLSHTEYVSKLCLIPGTNLLVSGGGDEWLGVWEWPEFRLRRKYDISKGLTDARKLGKELVVAEGQKELERHDQTVAVSGLWTVSFTNDKGKRDTTLLVALERLPAIFVIPASRLMLKNDEPLTEITLDHPPLDVTVVDDTAIISFDAREEGGKCRLQALRFRDGGVPHNKGAVDQVVDEEMEGKLKCISQAVGIAEKLDWKAVDELMYGIANLRKRRAWDTSGVPAERPDMGAPGVARVLGEEADD